MPGGEGQEIARLEAVIAADASQIVEAYQQTEEAGSAASRLTQQYLAAIERAFQEAGASGNQISQIFLDVGRAVLESGRGFGEASRAMRQVGDGGRYAADIVGRLKDQVQALNQAEEAGLRTSARFYGELEKRHNLDPNRRPGGEEPLQYRQVGEGAQQRWQRTGGGQPTRFVSGATAQAGIAQQQITLGLAVPAEDAERAAERRQLQITQREQFNQLNADRRRAEAQQAEEDAHRQAAQQGTEERNALRENRPFTQWRPGQARQRYEREQRDLQRQTDAAMRDLNEQMAGHQQGAEREARRENRAFTPWRPGQEAQRQRADQRAGGGGDEEGGFDPFGWVRSHSQVIRLGAGLLGVNLGINIIAGAARNLHQFLFNAADQVERMDRGARDLGTRFGAAGHEMQNFAGVLSQAQHFTLPSVQEAVLQTQELGRAYQFTAAQQQQVANTATALARMNSQDNTKLPALTQQLTQAIQQGGEVPELGINLTPQYINRTLGIDTNQMTVEAAATFRANLAEQQRQQQEDAQRALGLTPGQGTPEYEARQRRETATTAAGEAPGRLFDQVITGFNNMVANLMENTARAQRPYAPVGNGVQVTPEQARAGVFEQAGVAAWPELQNNEPTGRTALFRNDQRLQGAEEQEILARADAAAGNAATQAATAQETLATNLKKTAEAALSQITVLDREHGARTRLLTDIQSTMLAPGAAAAQLGQIARGPVPALAGRDAQAAWARGQAEQATEQERAAQAARREAAAIGPATAQTALLDTLHAEVAAAREATGAESQRTRDAEALLAVHERDLAYYTRVAQLDALKAVVDVARNNAQYQAEQVDFAARQRSLNVQNAQAEARVRVLRAETELAPLTLAQSRLQHEMEVTGRNTLSYELNLVRTRQQGLDLAERMQDITHGINANNAEAEQLMARTLRGQQVDPGRFRELMLNQRELSLQQAENAPAVEQQRYAEEVGQRPITREQLDIQAALVPLQARDRLLQDAVFYYRDQAQQAQNASDALQRQVDIVAALDTPLKTAAQQQTLFADETNAAYTNLVNINDALRLGVTMSEAMAKAWQQLGIAQGGAPSVPLYQGRGADFYGPTSVFGPAAGGGARAPGAQAAVPVVTATPPGQLGGVSVAVNLQGATINNMDDVERVANQAAGQAYNQTRATLIAVLAGARAPVNPSLAGAGR